MGVANNAKKKASKRKDAFEPYEPGFTSSIQFLQTCLDFEPTAEGSGGAFRRCLLD